MRPQTLLLALCLLWPVASTAQASGQDCATKPKKSGAAIYLTKEEIDEIRRGSGCKSFVRQIVALKKRMSTTGIETNFYDLKILPVTELVKGRKGRYYAVYLRDARRKRRFQFRGGRYVIRRFDTRFRASLAAFTRDVIAPLQGGLTYALYVRGSASSRPMRRKRKQSKKISFDTIEYLREAGADIYDANARGTVEVERRYGNEELPYLRAAFLSKMMGDSVPFARPTILQSAVADTKSRKAQFAEILLFVEWN